MPKAIVKIIYPKSSKPTKRQKEQYKLFTKLLRKERKRIFGEKTNVLDKDSFYKNIEYLGVDFISPKGKLTKKKLMKKGAISGCYLMNYPEGFD